MQILILEYPTINNNVIVLRSTLTDIFKVRFFQIVNKKIWNSSKPQAATWTHYFRQTQRYILLMYQTQSPKTVTCRTDTE